MPGPARAVQLISGPCTCGRRQVMIDKAALAETSETELRLQIAEAGVTDQNLIDTMVRSFRPYLKAAGHA